MAAKETMPVDSNIFTSTYRHDYIYFNDVKKVIKPYIADEFRLSPEQEKKFRSEYSEASRRQLDAVANLNVKAFEEENARILKERMKSVYTVDYRGDQGEVQKTVDTATLLDPDRDAIILFAERMYIHQPNSRPIKPLPSSRRVFGYSALKDYLTKHTEYQDTISKGGYNIIRAGLDRGLARLGPRFDYKKANAEVHRLKAREKDEGKDVVIEDIKPIDYEAIKFKPPPLKYKDCPRKSENLRS
ncbi:uncharacterized protein LOC106674188 [Cimex lectularius]|uniref:Uncharacterized protein n=1 Tax=Cimex lectularius TaxID=79782 RepID=A0A8I6TLJ6_CIMLE|nr:uncharacterized protein LOC106674188 [Cimex lectularius]